jgi:hypothetical protein
MKLKILALGILLSLLACPMLATAASDETPTPTTLEFKDSTGNYTIRLTFPYGQGKSIEEHYTMPGVYGEFVKVVVAGLSENEYYVNVEIGVIGASITEWRLYMRQNMWDAGPQTHIIGKDYSDTKNKFGLEARWTNTRETGAFYFIDIMKEQEGRAQFVVMRETEPEIQANCPACGESGMELDDAHADSFPKADPPYDETRCTYKKLDVSGDSIGEGVIEITSYTVESHASDSFYQDVEVSRDRMDAYESNKDQGVVPKRLADTSFDVFKYRMEHNLPDGSRFYEIVGLHLLGKHKIRITTQYHKTEADAEKAYAALENCAFSMIPGCAGNHPPKITATFLGYTPGPRGGLGNLQFEAKATDEDGDKLRFRWFMLSKEYTAENYDMIASTTVKDGVTTMNVSVPAPSVSGSMIFAAVYDDRGGVTWCWCSWTLPFQGMSTMDLPDVPWLDVAMGKVTVNGKAVLPGDIFVLKDGDIIETVPEDPSTQRGGGYAIIRYAYIGTVKITANTRVQFQGWKTLTLIRGRIAVEGEKWEHYYKESNRPSTGQHEFNVDVKGPQTLEQWFESFEDPQEREAWKERIKEMQTGASTGHWAGTQFEVISDEDGTTTYYVFEDLVDVSDVSMNKSVILRPGETTTVKPNEVPSDPVPFHPSVVDAWQPLGEFILKTNTESPSQPGLTFESRSKPTGSEVQIPLTLKGVDKIIGNMDLTLSYDPTVLEAVEVLKGSLTSNSIFESAISRGTIRIALADSNGFSGDGSVAYVRFNVIGAKGSSSPLQISESAANQSDYSVMTLATYNGLFQVIDINDLRGDCDGDGKLSAVDALCALQMAVGKKTANLSLDINSDGKVTSLDARNILKLAVTGQ